MSTTWRKWLLSFCLWHFFVTAIAQETCLYSPKRNGICVPYEDCKELHNKIFFPNEYCPRNTVCCPNALTTPPANDRIFSGILPSVYSNDNNLEPLPPLPDRVLKIWDIAATDNNSTTSLRSEIIKKKFQNPTQKSWTENADANEQALPPLPDSVLKIWDIPSSDVNQKTVKNAIQIKPKPRFMSEQDFQEIDAHNQLTIQEAPPPLPDNILKIWDNPPADVNPNLTLDSNSAKNELRKPPQAGFIYFPSSGNQLNNITPPTRLPIFNDYQNPSDVKLNKYDVPKTAKNAIQIKPQTRFMPEENFQGIDAHNKLTNQEAPSPLYDNILKIWGNPDADVKPTKNLGSTVKNEFRSPPRADLKPLPVDRPVYFPGNNNQLNTINPPTRLPLNELKNPSSPTDNLLRNFNKESTPKSTLNVKQKQPVNDLWKQPKMYGIPPISAAQAKADEEFFKKLLNTNIQQLNPTHGTGVTPTPALAETPKKKMMFPTNIDPTKRITIFNRNQAAPSMPNRALALTVTTIPPPTTTTKQIPYFDKEFYRRLGLAFGSKYDKYIQEQEVTPQIDVIENTTKVTSEENVTEQPNFLNNLNHFGLDKLNAEKCGFVHVNHDPDKSNVQTNIAEYPWLALLQYDIGNNEKNFSCGGSLITERWVLTAASCIKKSLIGVHLGAKEISNKDCARNKNCFKISQMVKHKDYKPETAHKDIALIKLRTRVRRSNNMKTVCLPTKLEHFDVPFEQKELTTAGWAVKREDFTANPRKHMLTRHKSQVCQQFYSAEVSQKSKMCLGGSDLPPNTCSGDHGGPVFWLVNDKKDAFTQIGVVPEEMDYCGGADVRPYYVESVADSMDWITNVIAEEM